MGTRDPFLRRSEDPEIAVEIAVEIAGGPVAESTRIRASAASTGSAPRTYTVIYLDRRSTGLDLAGLDLAGLDPIVL